MRRIQAPHAAAHVLRVLDWVAIARTAADVEKVAKSDFVDVVIHRPHAQKNRHPEERGRLEQKAQKPSG